MGRGGKRGADEWDSWQEEEEWDAWRASEEWLEDEWEESPWVPSSKGKGYGQRSGWSSGGGGWTGGKAKGPQKKPPTQPAGWSSGGGGWTGGKGGGDGGKTAAVGAATFSACGACGWPYVPASISPTKHGYCTNLGCYRRQDLKEKKALRRKQGRVDSWAPPPPYGAGPTIEEISDEVEAAEGRAV